MTQQATNAACKSWDLTPYEIQRSPQVIAKNIFFISNKVLRIYLVGQLKKIFRKEFNLVFS